MSFGSTSNLPPEDPKLFGLQKERVNSNEAARVLPWFAGTRWLGVNWLGDAFGLVTTPVFTSQGKSTTLSGYNYYASVVAVIGNGLVDTVRRVRFDEQIVWTGPFTRDDEDYTILTIEGRGLFALYWGTEMQSINGLLVTSGQEHTAYRGQCYIIGEDMFFGKDRTNAPNIQLELTRVGRPPWLNPSLYMIGLDANPVCVLWEWWTDKRFGLAQPEALLDTTRLASVAQQLFDEGLGVSPLLTADQDLRTSMVKLLEHVDGFPTTYDGKLGLELVRPATAVKRLTRDDYTKDPEYTSQTWNETFDETRVKYADLELEGNDNSVKYHDMANFLITGRHKPQNIDRPWVTNHEVAIKIAGAVGRVAGIPQSKGKVLLRESAAAAIQIGSVFDVETRDGNFLLMRCTDRTEPAPDRRVVDVEFVSDTGWANDEFAAAGQDVIPETTIYEPQLAEFIRILDSPYAFSEAKSGIILNSLTWMVARGDTYATSFDVYKSDAAAGTYKSASEQRSGAMFKNFGMRAELKTEYSAATLPVDEWTGIAFEVLSEDETMLEDTWTLFDALEHDLLAFFVDSTTHEINEIMSLYNVTRVSAFNYTALTVRGLYDTRRRTHEAGVEVWLQLRPRVDSMAWPPISEQARYYKFQPRFGAGEVALADLTAVSHTENQRTLRPIAPMNLAANGDGEHPTWTAGNDVAITWSNTARARTIDGVAFGDHPATDLDAVQFELRSYDGTILHDTFDEPADEAATLTSAYLVTEVNASFRLRAYGLRNKLRSLDYSDIAVVKV